jgi:hypothetical protein
MARTVAFLCGLLFGIGLALGGMTQPAVVLGFLDVAGAWNPTLLFVFGAAFAVTFVGYRFALRREKPLLAGERFHFPAPKAIDVRLLGGAALFGAGWGLAGYCPGPAAASLLAGHFGTLVFLLAMLIGMAAARR